MREILFRGKRIDNGKWVYGYYVYTKDSNGEYQHFIVTPKWFIVDPSTVGQYTGLTDKNGKRIFEGDIMHRVLYIGMGCGEMQGKVVYRAPNFLIECKHHRAMNFSQYGPENRDNEVIGNIHDNPELLEVGE